MKEGYIQSLVHACQCQDAKCHVPGCQKIKRVVHHVRVCMRKANGGCPVCQRLTCLCCYHAKRCQENTCPVLFCSNIKLKLKQHQLQQRLQKAQLLKRRMEFLSTSSAFPIASSSTNPMYTDRLLLPTRPIPHTVQSLLAFLPIRSPQEQYMILSVLRANPQLNAAFMKEIQARQGKVGPVGAPTNDPGNIQQQAVQHQMQLVQAEQQHQILSILKTNPQLMVDFIKHREWYFINHSNGPDDPENIRNCQPLQHLLLVLHYSPPSAEQHQQILSILKKNPQLMADFIKHTQAQQGGTVPGSAPIDDPENIRKKQTLQHLMLVLRSPPSPEQQQQILSILKANPQLMAAFIKQRQAAGGIPSQQQVLPGLIEKFDHLELE